MSYAPVPYYYYYYCYYYYRLLQATVPVVG